MTRKLIIDGNAVYEIDEECMLKNRVEDDDHEKEKKKETGCKYRHEIVRESTAGHGRLS